MREFDFVDERFISAKQKCTVIRAWARFLKNGLRRGHFTRALYHHLSQYCSFMAHYNIHGFYDYYFTSPKQTRKFLTQFDKRGPCLSTELGVPYWLQGPTAVDLNQAMVDVGVGYVPYLIEATQADEREIDLERAHALLSKHSIDTSDVPETSQVEQSRLDF